MTEIKPGDRVRVTIVHEGTVLNSEEAGLILVGDDGSQWLYHPAEAQVTVEKIDG